MLRFESRESPAPCGVLSALRQDASQASIDVATVDIGTGVYVTRTADDNGLATVPQGGFSNGTESQGSRTSQNKSQNTRAIQFFPDTGVHEEHKGVARLMKIPLFAVVVALFWNVVASIVIAVGKTGPWRVVYSMLSLSVLTFINGAVTWQGLQGLANRSVNHLVVFSFIQGILMIFCLVVISGPFANFNGVITYWNLSQGVFPDIPSGIRAFWKKTCIIETIMWSIIALMHFATIVGCFLADFGRPVPRFTVTRQQAKALNGARVKSQGRVTLATAVRDKPDRSLCRDPEAPTEELQELPPRRSKRVVVEAPHRSPQPPAPTVVFRA